jgi:type II secretory pathway component PulK
MEQFLGKFKRFWSARRPETLYGFPVGDGTEPLALGREKGKRGIALLIAIMIISIMMLFTSDLILSSQVNIKLATTGRDNIKAEFLAKSAFNASLLLLSSDLAYDLYQAQQNPKATLSDGLGDIWTALNGLPIGGETAEMTAAFAKEFGLNGFLDSNVIDQLKLFDGSFTVNVADESQKINVNYCANSRCTETLMMLEALFACPAEKAFLENKKVTGRELAYRIKDWVDSDSRAEDASGFSDEDTPYVKRRPKMQAKNAQFDSVEEMRLIEGWDEEVHQVFSPFITVFPFQSSSTDKRFQININTASRGLLQCLFPEARGDCNEKVAVALKKRSEDQSLSAQPGKPMAEVLRELLCYNTGDANSGEANNKSNWFASYSMVYRIEATGEVGDSVKKITAVVERIMPDIQKGEKSSFKILYWKLI